MGDCQGMIPSYRGYPSMHNENIWSIKHVSFVEFE